jgi:hypothetical protein
MKTVEIISAAFCFLIGFELFLIGDRNIGIIVILATILIFLIIKLDTYLNRRYKNEKKYRVVG